MPAIKDIPFKLANEAILNLTLEVLNINAESLEASMSYHESQSTL